MAKGIHDERYRGLLEALRDARLALGMSQAGLGRLINQRQQYVSKYESGERRLDVVEFIDVATALGIDWKPLLAACQGAAPDTK